jgi:bacterioferritin
LVASAVRALAEESKTLVSTPRRKTMSKEKVIDALNAARGRELHAILQYMSAHYELEDQQYGKLAKVMKEIAIEEMKHAEALAERILFIGGTPIYKPDALPKKGLDIAGILKLSAELEEQAVAMYNKSIQLCRSEGDDGSKEVFDKLLADEEKHFDTFDTMLDHVQKLGAAYLATLTS